MKKIFILAAILFSILLAANTGTLNIFTDKKDVDIYIGNNRIGRGEISGYQLEPGSYYIKVMDGEKKIYGGLAVIKEGEETTIVADDFKDTETAQPSKGPQKRDKARITDARKRTAWGLHFGSPAGGLSLKHWFNEAFGWQGIAWHSDNGTTVAGNSGNRILLNLSNKIQVNTMQNAYLAIGAGSSSYINRTNDEENWTYKVSEIVLGFEWFKIIPDELIIAQPSFEIGFENRTTFYPERSGRNNLKYSGLKASYSVHMYF